MTKCTKTPSLSPTPLVNVNGTGNRTVSAVVLDIVSELTVERLLRGAGGGGGGGGGGFICKFVCGTDILNSFDQVVEEEAEVIILAAEVVDWMWL